VDACPFRWQTKYIDAETGLYYFGYRFFDSLTGRWLSRDPLEEDGGVNLYAFCGNDPVNGVDPLGLEPFKIDIFSFFRPFTANQMRKEPLPADFVEQQAALHKMAVCAATIPMAVPIVVDTALAVPADAGAAVGVFNGASGVAYETLIAPVVRNVWKPAVSWMSRSLVGKATLTILSVEASRGGKDIGPAVRASSRSGFVIIPQRVVKPPSLSTPKPQVGSTVQANGLPTYTQMELDFGQSLPWQRGESGLLLGRYRDLLRPGVKGPGEFNLSWIDVRDKLGDEVNLLANLERLKKVTDLNLPIRDVSSILDSSSIYLNGERLFLGERLTWTLKDGKWIPAGGL
jgi:RHS repeat-associated protein